LLAGRQVFTERHQIETVSLKGNGFLFVRQQPLPPMTIHFKKTIGHHISKTVVFNKKLIKKLRLIF